MQKVVDLCTKCGYEGTELKDMGIVASARYCPKCNTRLINKIIIISEKLLELVSQFLHEDIWAHWMKHMKSLELKRGHSYDGSGKPYSGKPYHTIRISHDAENIERWDRQMNTPYKHLSGKEKNSDRDLASSFIKHLKEQGYSITRSNKND